MNKAFTFVLAVYYLVHRTDLVPRPRKDRTELFVVADPSLFRALAPNHIGSLYFSHSGVTTEYPATFVLDLTAHLL